MKLTKTMREHFVLMAMQDVPSIDYRTKVQDLVNRASIAALPPAVRAAYATNPEYITKGGHFFSGLGYVNYVGCNSSKFLAGVETEVAALIAAEAAQSEARGALREKLLGVAMSVTTAEKLTETMPEFVKYISPKPVDTKNLPAISNLVADFVAAGWPAAKAVAA